MKNNKPKTKTHTFWCVVDPQGMPFLYLFQCTKRSTIEKFIESRKRLTFYSWNELRKLGYTCQKFTIKTKIK